MYKTIINPVNGTELNIYSEKGKEIVHKYTDHYNQLGGGDSSEMFISMIAKLFDKLKDKLNIKGLIINIFTNIILRSSLVNFFTVELKIIPVRVTKQIIEGIKNIGLKPLTEKITGTIRGALKYILPKNSMQMGGGGVSNLLKELTPEKLKLLAKTLYLTIKKQFKGIADNFGLIFNPKNLIKIFPRKLHTKLKTIINENDDKDDSDGGDDDTDDSDGSDDDTDDSDGGDYNQIGGEPVTITLCTIALIVAAVSAVISLIVLAVTLAKAGHAIIKKFEYRSLGGSALRVTKENDIKKILSTKVIKATEASYFTDNIGQNIRQKEAAFKMYYKNYIDKNITFLPKMECIRCEEFAILPGVEDFSSSLMPYWDKIIYGKDPKSTNIRMTDLGIASRSHNLRFKRLCTLNCPNCRSDIIIDTYFIDAAIIFNIATNKLAWRTITENEWGKENSKKLNKFYKDLSGAKFLISTLNENIDIEIIKEILFDGINSFLTKKYYENVKKKTNIDE